jgi:hypothetical protein
MKVLFLDVDGVLNSAAWFAQSVSTNEDYLGLRQVDPACVKRLLGVIEKTGAMIVLSSTWRLVPEYVDTLRSHGLDIPAMTPRIDSNNRGEEIKAWLEKTGGIHVEKFAIVDDDADAGDHGLRSHFVQTSFACGLTDADAAALVALLS